MHNERMRVHMYRMRIANAAPRVSTLVPFIIIVNRYSEFVYCFCNLYGSPKVGVTKLHSSKEQITV